MPAFLTNIPRVAFVAVVPLAVFLVAAAVSFGTGGGDNDSASAVPTVTATRPVSAAAATPTQAAVATATPQATATVLADRTDCAAIRGSDYRSAAERTWFNENCTGTAAASSGSTGSSGSSGSTGSTGGSSVPSGGSGGTGSGPSIGSGGEYPLGDQLIIPAAGVNASVSGVKVGSSGVMPDPIGYYNAVWYDFSALGGLGGYVNGGNLVVAGHVDCGRCNNGGAGIAVFYNTRYLSPGDTIQYRTASGVVQNYVVFSNVDYSADADFAGVVAAGTADITIITCTGSFSGGHYNLRNVVFGRKV